MHYIYMYVYTYIGSPVHYIYVYTYIGGLVHYIYVYTYIGGLMHYSVMSVDIEFGLGLVSYFVANVIRFLTEPHLCVVCVLPNTAGHQ